MHTKNYKIAVKETVAVFTDKLFYALFDEAYKVKYLKEIKDLFFEITEVLEISNSEVLWEYYQSRFKKVRQQLDLDALAFEQSDPAAKSLEEVYLAYPGFLAIAIYRLTHELYILKVPVLPRMMSEYAHSLTGTDIHPGAKIGASFFIDHATGIVIGETTVIKDHVKIYQGVTLGGLQVKKSLSNTKRHPTIESNVTLYANATVLGGNVSVGKNSIIGANVCVMQNVPENSLVIQQSEYTIIKREKTYEN